MFFQNFNYYMRDYQKFLKLMKASEATSPAEYGAYLFTKKRSKKNKSKKFKK